MEKSESKVAKVRKSSSIVSHHSGDGLTPIRVKEHKHLIRIETLNPTTQGSISPINQLVNYQDTELKEIILFTDEILQSFLRNVDANDHLIGVNLCQDGDVLSKPDDNRLIQIRGFHELDMLRNGLQSAVSIQCQIKTPTMFSRKSQSSLPKVGPSFIDGSNNSSSNGNSSLVDNANETMTNDTLAESQSTQTVISFNYQMVLALNNEYFSIEQPSSSVCDLLRIRLLRKPAKWTSCDLAELTIEPLKYPNRSGFRQRNSPMYLNSKALIDRLYGHFNRTIRDNWPRRQPAVANPLIHKIHIIGEEPHMSLSDLSQHIFYRSFSARSSSSRSSGMSSQRRLMPESSIHDYIRNVQADSVSDKEAKKDEHMRRKCLLDMNRVKIEFKWKGNKPHFRNLKLTMTIAMVVDINHNYELEKVTSDIVKQCKIDPNDWRCFCVSLRVRLNLPPSRIFLSPASFVHMWTLDTRLAKLNLLKLLLVYELLKNVTNSSDISGILLASERLNTSNSLQANLEEIGRVNTNWTMLSFLRLLQIHFSQFLEKWKPPKLAKNLNIQDMDTEELLVNLVLDETKSNATWTFEKLFERLWSALVKLRCQLAVDQDVSDVFGFVRNQVPAYVLGNLEIHKSSQRTGSQMVFIPAYEAMLRRLVKSVMSEDVEASFISEHFRANSVLNSLVIIKLNDELLSGRVTSSKAVNFGSSTLKSVTMTAEPLKN